MPSAQQLSTIQAALAQVNPAIPTVQGFVKQATDPGDKLQLTQYSILLTNTQTALTEAQVATDNAVFAADTAKLNALAAALKKQAASIGKVLTAIDTAGKLAGYVAKVIELIGKI
jgi:hypothetical protein